jgi:hypothetical protein
MPGLFSSWERRQNRALEIDYAGPSVDDGISGAATASAECNDY